MENTVSDQEANPFNPTEGADFGVNEQVANSINKQKDSAPAQIFSQHSKLSH